jgi:molybdopterin-guanine dinucleotide biosynthesis protein A
MMSEFTNDCIAVILAGGENRRMPVLKAFIEVEGRRIIERNLRIMKQLFHDTYIITNQPEQYSYLDTSLLGDVYGIRGPMTGIFTALLNSTRRWVFITACDMPFISEGLIRHMASKRVNCDAVVPMYKGRPEPLFAFYSTRLRASLERSLSSGQRSMKRFLLNHRKRVQYITSREIKKIDMKGHSFINLNTPEDVDFFLGTEDTIKFRKSAERRGTCSALVQQN